MKAEIAKLLLLVAAILGLIQGTMTLIGGIIAGEDVLTDEANTTIINIGKYGCGFMRYELSTSGGSCPFKKIDRGWFKRVYLAIKDGLPAGSTVSKDDLKSLTGYEAVLGGYGLICGIGWIVAGVLALIGSFKQNKPLAIIAGIIFVILYALFIALFGAVWDSQLKMEDSCPGLKNCDDAKRSSREFLGYSICSFILILASIVLCFLYAFTAEGTRTDPVKDDKLVSDRTQVELKGKENMIPPASSDVGKTPNPDQKAVGAKGSDNKGATSINVVSAPAPAPVPAPAPAHAPVPVPAPAPAPNSAAEVASMFGKVNKYLTDDVKLAASAEKKFAAIDKDKSGKMTHEELKKFITEIMAKKKLPEPNDKKVAALLAKYDKDKSGTLEKAEFKNMLHDIFMGSREILISRYAAKKAEALKGSKPPVTDTSGAVKMEELLKNTNAFYTELSVVAKEVDKDKSSSLNEDEMVMLIGKFCAKYNLPPMTKPEITGVMNEMGRDIKEYNIKDLRMIALAILSIAKNIVKPK